MFQQSFNFIDRGFGSKTFIERTFTGHAIYLLKLKTYFINK